MALKLIYYRLLLLSIQKNDKVFKNKKYLHEKKNMKRNKMGKNYTLFIIIKLK